jgi:hypothetical protein
MRESLRECDQTEFVVPVSPRQVGIRSTYPDSSATHAAPSGPIARPCGSLPGGRSIVTTSAPSPLTRDLVRAPQTHPYAIVGIGDHAVRFTRQLHFLDRLVHRDAAELVGEDLGDPQRIVVGSS